MGQITRTTKPGSTTSFATSRDLGHTLQVSDLDGDLNAVAAVVNGQITDENIPAGANIAGTKLADNSIPGGKLSTGIPTSRLDADGGLTTDHLGDGIVTTDKLADGAVTGAKLAASARLVESLGNAPYVDWSGVINPGAGEITLAATGTLVARGAPVHLLASIPLVFRRVSGATTSTITFRLRRSLTQIKVWTIAPQSPGAALSGVFDVPFMFSAMWVDSVAAGSYVYTISAEVTGTGWQILGPSSAPGDVLAVEYA